LLTLDISPKEDTMTYRVRAGTDADVFIVFVGSEGESGKISN